MDVLSETRASETCNTKILVIGASQGTGALAVKAALEQGHDVTAFARSPEKLALEHPKLKKVKGDFHSQASVSEVLKGYDAVLVTASATSLKAFKENPNYFSMGTRFVIDAMKKEGVKRLVILSALGAGDSYKLMNVVLRKLVVDFILKTPFEDHGRQETMTRESGLEWVIVRPGRLTDGPAKGTYVKKAVLEKVPGAISRADVADFLVEAAVSPTWKNKDVQIGG